MKLRIIYKGTLTAGILWRDEKGYQFEYDHEFIVNEKTSAISVNMPKSQKTYQSDRLFPNFQSMLCEGHNRKIQCNALGIDISDDWQLLAYTCEHDTIGALTVQRIEE